MHNTEEDTIVQEPVSCSPANSAAGPICQARLGSHTIVPAHQKITMSATKPWEVRFQDLLDFKAQHGHCNVPRAKATDAPHRSLGRWVNKMRGHYKQHLLGKPSGPLTIDRIKLLEKAGFKWDGRNKNKSRPKTGGASTKAAAV